VRALAVAAASLVLAAAAAAAQPPTLRLVGSSPITVAGARFHANERVRVYSDGKLVARTITSRIGSFSVALPAVASDRCKGFSFSAVGAAGERATLAPKLQPACPLS
jgi:hypothetical protein